MGKFFNTTLMDKNFRRRLPLVHPGRPRFVFNKSEPAKDTPVAKTEAIDTFEPKSIKCPDCDFVVKAESKNPSSSLRFHRRGKHKETVEAAA